MGLAVAPGARSPPRSTFPRARAYLGRPRNDCTRRIYLTCRSRVSGCSSRSRCPSLASLLAPMSTVDLDLSPARRAPRCWTRGALPSVDTWTFTAAGLPWVDQQWGSQVVLHAVAIDGWLDRAGPAARRPRSDHLRAALAPDRPTSRSRRAARRRCSRSRRSSSPRRPGAAPAAARDGLLRRRPAARHGPPRPPARALAGPGRSSPSGRTSTAASSWGRSSSASPGSRTSTTVSTVPHRRSGHRARERRGGVPDPVRPVGLGATRSACRRTRR